MEVKLSPWSIAILLVAIVLALNVLNVISIDAWSVFGLVVTIVCAWAIWWLFVKKQ